MGRAAWLVLLATVVSSQTCSNPVHAKFWPQWVTGTTTKLLSSETPITCNFSKCTPLFTNRQACNRIGIAYHPHMAQSNMPDFTFRSNSRAPIPRSNFHKVCYDPLVATFNSYTNNGLLRSTNVINIGALDYASASTKATQLRRGDVLVYVANEYQVGGVNDICERLVQNGVIVVPVFVGTEVNLSQLSLLSDSQKTGGILAELQKASADFTNVGTAGLILPAVDYATGSSVVSNNMGRRRREAIVMFSRLFAQCPNSCLSTCDHETKSENYPSVKFPVPPSGEQGCCGPIGAPGSHGLAGVSGERGCMGGPGAQGDRGPDGPSGPAGPCGRSGSPGQPGMQGDKGGTGKPGMSGPDGPCGNPGSAGGPGASGQPGPNGSKGLSGPAGSCGPNGMPGSRGPTGRQGDPGEHGVDGIGMVKVGNDDYDGDRQALFARALSEIMQDRSIWKQVYDIENQYDAWVNNVAPIKSCFCD